MATHYKTRAIIFQKADINDSDRIFSVFSEEFGRLDVHAKAIRKINSKLKGGIDIFFMSDIEFIQGKNRKTLTDAVAIEKFNGIFQLSEKLNIANKIREIMECSMPAEERDSKIFGLLKEVFYKLNDRKLESSKHPALYYFFLWNMLSLLGYCPEVQKCAECGQKLNPYGIYFSNKSGGIICKKCLAHDASSQKINSDAVKILRTALNKDWSLMSRLKTAPISQKLFQDVSDRYYLYNFSKS